jgi:hypothetical protein
MSGHDQRAQPLDQFRAVLMTPQARDQFERVASFEDVLK